MLDRRHFKLSFVDYFFRQSSVNLCLYLKNKGNVNPKRHFMKECNHLLPNYLSLYT